MAITFSNGYAIGRTPPSSLNFFVNLGAITSYLSNYMTDFRNPDFYSYNLDGDGYFIYDGGNDMYDGGNATSPWLISNVSYISSQSYNTNAYPYAVNYQTTSTPGAVDGTFGYLSLGYNSPSLLPLTVIGTRATTANPGDPIGFQTGGNSGADGGGQLAEGNIYTGDTVSGFTVHSYYRETFDAGDPSHCDVYILLGHADWNSVFGTVYYGSDPVSNGGCGGYLYTSGGGAQNVLAVKTLLSKPSGAEVTFNDVKAVVDNFIIRINEAKLGAVPMVPSPTPTSTPAPTPTPSPIPLTQLSNDGTSNNIGTILLLDGTVATTGTTILDQSGSGRNFTYTGSDPYTGAGYYQFQSGGYATMDDSTIFDSLLNTISITMWVNFPSIMANKSLFSRTQGANPGWAFRAAPGLFNLVKYNVADQYSNGSFTYTTNTWYHIGIVQGGTSLMFTLNGVVVGSITSDSTNFANNNYPFMICKDTYDVSNIPLKLAKLKITDGFMTSSDVLNEFNSEKATYGY